MESKYDDEKYIEEHLKLGTHREIIGGLWEELGTLQLEFMQRRGLQPQSLLLDVGCGTLRGGVKFVQYLHPNHYFGIDISQSLLEAGYAHEIAPHQHLADKLPPRNLQCIDTFEATGFGRQFDYALAQSVFTHLTFNSIRLCLENIAKVLKPGGQFCATWFRIPDDQPTGIPQQHPGGIITHANKDPYHYRIADFQHAIRALPWTLEDELDWAHPRGQRMLIFNKTA